MLVVLGVLVLTVTAVATTARLASTVALGRDTDRAISLAQDLERQSEQLIIAWLENESSSVVLPADVAVPSVALPTHLLQAADGQSTLQITAFDQCGMVAMTAAAGDPVRGTLPNAARRALDRLRLTPRGTAGLDLLMAVSDEMPVYPGPPGQTETRRFAPQDGSDSLPSDSGIDDAIDESSPESPLALGAILASHQPRGVININTAPRPLLEHALRIANIGGLDEIVTARESGKIASIPGTETDRGGRQARSRRAPRGIATSSNAWAFRIDIQIGTMKRSWWRVYVNGDSRRRSSWQCVQQLVIAR